MFNKIASLLFLLIFFSCSRDLSSLQQEKKATPVRPLSTAEQQLVQTSQNFGLKLFREVNKQDPDKNLFISPLSVSMALGMTMNGASGETYSAMRQTLDFGELSEDEINAAYRSLIDLLLNLDPKVIMEIANSIWPRQDYPILQSFLDVNKTNFDAEIRLMDYSNSDAAKEIINTWVSDKTHGKIKDILDYVPSDVIMYLINAIYFKGTWTYQFDKEQTKLDVFYNYKQEAVDCQMMKISGDWLYYKDNSVQVIELPYGDSLFCMTMLLPAASKSVDDLIAGLDAGALDAYLNGMSKQFGTLDLPKIKVEYKLLMNDVLTALGMGIAFTDQADFSRINGFSGLLISRVIHQTFVQVDEEGTEAAAATVVEIRETSSGPEGFTMRVDRPYVFVIRERVSGAILFIGKIIEPQWQN
jgi:serpin B